MSMEVRLPSRSNGISLPLHPLQLLVVVVIIYFSLTWYCVTVPALLTAWQPAGYTIIAVVLISHIVTYSIATVINPADDSVIHKAVKGTSAKLDRSLHKHAIENEYCYLCSCSVGVQSKHCSLCNKCVDVFDHHCIWLNNCVGRKNYRTFIVCLVTGLAGALIITGFNLMVFIAYYTDKDSGHILLPYSVALNGSTAATTTTLSSTAQFYMFFQPVPYQVFLAITFFTAILALIALILLSHLLGFHIYLACKGVTTYEHIVQQRNVAELEAQTKRSDLDIQEREEQSTTSTSCFKVLKRSKKSSVAPVSTTSMSERDPNLDYPTKEKTEYSLV